MTNRNNYLYTFSKEGFNKKNSINYYHNKELSSFEYENAIILPLLEEKTNSSWSKGGVLDSEQKYIECSALKAKGYSHRMYGQYRINESNIIYKNESVIYIGYIMNHWGHFLMDSLSRFWYLLKDNKKIKIVYLSTDQFEFKNNYLELIKLLGIDINRFERIVVPTQYAKVIIPEPSFIVGDYYTNEHISLFDHIADMVKYIHEYPKKIYFSRTRLPGIYSREMGEFIIEKIYRKNGYKILYPERLTLSEQIAHIRKADECACLSGSIPHNFLFANNYQKLTIINKSYLINDLQIMVDQLRQLDVNYVDAYFAMLPVGFGYGPFIIYLNDKLKDYLNDNNMKYIEKIDYLPLFIKWYYKYYPKNNIKIDNNIILSPPCIYKYFFKIKELSTKSNFYLLYIYLIYIIQHPYLSSKISFITLKIKNKLKDFFK